MRQSATLLHKPWPGDRLLGGLRVGAFVLAVVALVLFPRHETAQDTSDVVLLPARERA